MKVIIIFYNLIFQFYLLEFLLYNNSQLYSLVSYVTCRSFVENLIYAY